MGVGESAVRLLTEDFRRIAGFDAPGLWADVDGLVVSSEMSLAQGPIVCRHEREPEQAQSDVGRDARDIRGCQSFWILVFQAIRIKNRVDHAETDDQRQDVGLHTVTDMGAVVLQAPFNSPVGVTLEDVGGHVEATKLHFDQYLILFCIKHRQGQRV